MFSQLSLIIFLFIFSFQANAAEEGFFSFFSTVPAQPSVPERADSLPGFKGTINFTQEEVDFHRENSAKMSELAGQCLEGTLEKEKQFHEKYGIGAFYGTESTFAKLDKKAKIDYLKENNVDEKILAELEMLSCVDFMIKCLRESMTKTHQEKTFWKIYRFVAKNGGDGTSLLLAMQRLGWRVLYWAEDTSRLKEYDKMESTKTPKNEDGFWGFHEYRYAGVVGPEHRYHHNPVDDAKTLVNYKDGTPAALEKFPYWIGTAHTGFHMFSGVRSTVIEGHSDTELEDTDSLEKGKFQPLQQHPDAGGFGHYRSGIIAVPPGF